jgi:uncharacterized protein (TIGR02186 family)
MRWWLILCLLVAPAHAGDETIVAGLSQNRVSITADFDGSEILIYGAVKRDAPVPDKPMEVIVTVEGPSTPLTIREKSRRFGMWINTSAVNIDAAPSFYAIATTGPLRQIISDTENLRYKVTIPSMISAIGIASETATPDDFITGLLRIRLGEGRYRLDQGAVEFLEETLFRADVELPANLTDGEYRVRIFLTRGGRVIDSQERVIGVRKEGVERFIYNLAKEQPLVTGIASVLMAVVAGWAASTAFRLVRL